MNPNEYQELAKRTARQNYPVLNLNDTQLMNWLLGLSGETGELCNSVKKFMFHRASIDSNVYPADWIVGFIDELGDILWYISQICCLLNVSMEDVMQKNIDKLKARYPDSFPTDSGKDAHL